MFQRSPDANSRVEPILVVATNREETLLFFGFVSAAEHQGRLVSVEVLFWLFLGGKSCGKKDRRHTENHKR